VGFEIFSRKAATRTFFPGNPRETSEEEIAGLYRSLLESGNQKLLFMMEKPEGFLGLFCVEENVWHIG